MGRHGSARRRTDDDASQVGDLVGWGLFAAPATTLALGLAGGGWLLATFVGALVALAFGVVWLAANVAAARSPHPPQRDVDRSATCAPAGVDREGRRTDP